LPFLLDTNILSELRKGSRCDPNVSKWAAAESTQAHYISVLSLGEICKSIELLRKKSSEKCVPLENWLEKLHSDYANCIIAITPEISERSPLTRHQFFATAPKA
jgi:toxin FitB